MDWMQFIASLVASLAWPSAVVFGLWLVRSHLGQLLGRLLELHLPGGTKVIFKEVLATGGAAADKIEQKTPGARVPPSPESLGNPTQSSSASPGPTVVNILLSYADVEAELTEARSLLGMKPIYGPEFVVNVLVSKNLVPAEMMTLFKSVRTARNLVAHGRIEHLSSNDVTEFERQASIVLESVREAIKKLRAP